MKINTNEIWKHVGDFIILPESEDIPSGTYQIVDEDYDGITLFDFKKEVILEVEHIPQGDYVSVHGNQTEKLELLYEANVKVVLNLMRDGWVLPTHDNLNPTMDISPWVAKTNILKILIDAKEAMYE